MELSPTADSTKKENKSKADDDVESAVLISDTESEELDIDAPPGGEFDIKKEIHTVKPRKTCCPYAGIGKALLMVVGMILIMGFMFIFLGGTFPARGQGGDMADMGMGGMVMPTPVAKKGGKRPDEDMDSTPVVVLPPTGVVTLPVPPTANPPTANPPPANPVPPNPPPHAFPPARLPFQTPPADPSPNPPPNFPGLPGVPPTDAAQTPQVFDRKEMRRLATLLQPRSWNVSSEPKQFLHMHHMKTGGTTVDALLSCALSRWSQITGKSLPYYRVSECAGGVSRCTDVLARNDTASCPVHSAAVMSYCAALDAVDRFGWGNADKFTVLRDPVDRVWSMYRFSLQGCYQCKTVETVYQELDSGVNYPGVCGSQMLNHQTENMLSAAMRAKESTLTEEELIQEAINNMNTRFAVIGITGHFLDSIAMITKVFPFLGHNLTELSGGAVRDQMYCAVGHANEGRPPSCGTPALTPEIRAIIEQHNQRDMRLFAAAELRFQKQKMILLDGMTFDDDEDEELPEDETQDTTD